MTAEEIFTRLAAAGSGAYAVSADQTIMFWDRGAEQILGIPAEQAVGRPCHQVGEGGLTPECTGGCASMRRLREGLIPQPLELRMPSASGERKPVPVTPAVVVGLLDGDPLLVHVLNNGEDNEGPDRPLEDDRDLPTHRHV